MKSVIVTGATGYFGKYIVNELVKDYQVIGTSRSLSKLDAAFAQTPNIVKAELDMGNLNACEEVLTKLCAEHEVVGLINNAYDFSKESGFNTQEGRLENFNVEQLRSAFDVGLLAPVLFTKIVGKQMIEKKLKGSIVNISSMYGLVAPDARLYDEKSTLNPVSYGVMKAGLNGLTRYTASFWGRHGIRCNSIAPGAFPNTETATFNANKDDEFLERLANKTCLGRWGHPKDLLGLIKLLLSDEGSYITGQTISVDGGWTAI